MKSKFLLISIFLLAFILRFWNLGSNPSSLDWDEASLGYNAYSILKTGKDEYGNFLPTSIRSFNDYKPPLYTYLTILPVSLLGLTEVSVRLISGVMGLIAVIATFYLIYELISQKKIAHLTSFFLAVSPWHIQFSRIAFESNIALTLIILAVIFFLIGLRNGKSLLLSSLLFGLSLYAYHSPRLIVPILIIGMVLVYLPRLKSKINFLILFLIILSIFYLPVIKDFRNSTGARFASVSVVNPDEKLGQSIKAIELDQNLGNELGRIIHNRRIVFGREILAGYLDHFNFDFLFLSGDPPGRHHAADQGMLYFFDLPLVVLGFAFLLKNIRNSSYQTVLLWFMIAPLASSLTSGTPHAVRAIFYLPIYPLLISFGIINFLNYIKSPGFTKRKLLFFAFCVLYFCNFYYYLHQYYVHSPIEYAMDWQYGYKQAVKVVDFYDENVNKIIVTYRYDQPYIYFLFYNKIDPSWYQNNWGKGEINRAERKFSKYIFRNIDWEKDKNQENVLIVGTSSEIPENAEGIIAEIPFPDGNIAFRIVHL